MTRYDVMYEGRRVSCRRGGRGGSVVFVHADFVDSRMWDEVAGLLEDQHRVVLYDKLGYGSSEKAPGRMCRRRELADVVRSVGESPVHLVGCSNGGQQALDFCLEHPQRVCSLTLVNATPSGFQPEGAPPAEIVEMIQAVQEGRLAEANQLQTRIWFDGPERTVESLDTARRSARALAQEMNRIFVENGTFFSADVSPLDPLVPPALQRLGEVRAPTLVVSGKLDYAENRRASQILANGIPGARFVEMPDCAHVPALEAPKEFASVLGEFLFGVG